MSENNKINNTMNKTPAHVNIYEMKIAIDSFRKPSRFAGILCAEDEEGEAFSETPMYTFLSVAQVGGYVYPRPVWN